jgi:photosystem II stability/assembly factor-like uncharacterized protein
MRGRWLGAVVGVLGMATGCAASPAASGAGSAATIQRSLASLPVVPAGAGTTVRMLTARLGLAITQRGVVLQTTDGGRTWQNTTPTGYRVVGPMASVADVAWLVAEDASGRSLLLITPNGGFSFHDRPLPEGVEATAVAGLGFATVNRGWLVANHQGQYTLYVTDNSGFSWHVRGHPPAAARLPDGAATAKGTAMALAL